MPTFPTLAKIADGESFTEDIAVDPTLRSNFENGVIHTRNKFTTVPKRWRILYRFLSNTDKASIVTFFNTTVKFGADTFGWTNPVDDSNPNVRFESFPTCKLENDGQNTWKVSFGLIEVP